jgi:ribosomal protein S8
MRQLSSNKISDCLAHLNLAYNSQKLQVELPFCHSLNKFLRILVLLGVIQSFGIIFFHSRGNNEFLNYVTKGVNTNSYNKNCNHSFVGISKFLCLSRKNVQTNQNVNIFVNKSKSSYSKSFIIYLKYSGHTPVFSKITNYWSLRYKIVVPYNSIRRFNCLKTRGLFLL